MRRIYPFLIFATISSICYANSMQSTRDYDPLVFLWLVFFIFLSRGLSIVRKIGLPLIVGEIFAGVILGSMDIFGINLFKDTESNTIVKFLADFGAIILMFEIGLESKLSDLKRNFRTGIKVALSGTFFTFMGGFFISFLFIPNASTQLNLLIGVITAATATGIAAKTFKEMEIIHSREVKIVMVSSILDEVISIFCFAVISALIIDNTINLINISISIVQVMGFFMFAAIFGQWITPLLTTWSTKIHSGINMKIGVLLIICFLFAWLSHIMGLASVIGAFIAGLILDEVYFKSFSKSNFFQQLRQIAKNLTPGPLHNELINSIEQQEQKTLEELLKPLSHVFVPVFFIHIGLMLEIEELFKYQTLIITCALLVVSFIGRLLSGHLIRGNKVNKTIIGLGMSPIGEAGLIFAVFGKNVGIISSPVLSAIVSTLVISAILTPILIKISIKLKGIHYD